MASYCVCGFARRRSPRRARRWSRQCGLNRRKTLESAWVPLADIILLAWGKRRTTGMIQHISAVTFTVRDMARSVAFYRKLGFEPVYGGERAEFSSLKAGTAFVNLVASSGYEHRWWG